MKKNKVNMNFKIPFKQRDGKIVYLGYPDFIASEEVDNFFFKDILKFDGFSRGRSSAKACFISSETRNEYEMFLTDLELLIRDGKFSVGGIVDGEFSFTKRGQNYGVVFVED